MQQGKQEIKRRTKQKNGVDGFQSIHAIGKRVTLNGRVISF
jgi:hypothetical protein